MGPARFDQWVKADSEFDKDLIIIEQERVPTYREYITDSWLRDYFEDFVPEGVAYLLSIPLRKNCGIALRIFTSIDIDVLVAFFTFGIWNCC